MHRLKCHTELRERVRDFQKSTFELRTQQQEIIDFRDSLSISLRERMRHIVFDATFIDSYLIIYVYLHQLRL